MNDFLDATSWRPKQAAAFLCIGMATLWRWVSERPDFPRPIRLSAKCTIFNSGEIVAWRNAQAEKTKA